MEPEDIEDFVKELLKDYPINVKVEILETYEIDELDRSQRQLYGPPVGPRMIADSNLKNPRIFIEKLALAFYPAEEFKAKIAHETFHIAAKYLGYRSVLERVYLEYTRMFPINFLIRLLTHTFNNLWESCTDQEVITHSLGKELYKLRKHQSNYRLKVPNIYKPRDDDEMFLVMSQDWHVSISFHLAGLKEEAKDLDNLLIECKRKQGIRDELLREYNRFIACMSIKNPPTEQKVRNSFNQILDLYVKIG
ncbi:MAG: hypothetical protein QMD14_04225 [Candidatus Aenigmarchaeota archaeon]|nr:hypothetical protein [Candidatus Aenigmarchaeota archaeon]